MSSSLSPFVRPTDPLISRRYFYERLVFSSLLSSFISTDGSRFGGCILALKEEGGNRDREKGPRPWAHKRERGGEREKEKLLLPHGDKRAFTRLSFAKWWPAEQISPQSPPMSIFYMVNGRGRGWRRPIWYYTWGRIICGIWRGEIDGGTPPTSQKEILMTTPRIRGRRRSIIREDR